MGNPRPQLPPQSWDATRGEVAPSSATSPFNVTATSEHVHNGALQPHSQRLGAGEAAGPAGQVLGGDRELAAGLSNQQVLAGPGEGEGQPVERHIVRGA